MENEEGNKSQLMSASDVRRSLGGQFSSVSMEEIPAKARPSDVDGRGASGREAGSSSQAMRRKRSRPDDDEEESVPAYIRTIRMDNFMCHDQKNVPLKPRMNFISGNNGSGKSATLVALCTCLGAKGRDTNRADSLGGLIGTYANQAIVEVTIAIDPKHPVFLGGRELSGDLVVRRTMRKSGQNDLQIFLKSEDGRVTKISPGNGRAKPSDDLRSILDDLNIQVDNPIQVMHQDKTKTFLASAQSEKFNKYYELFSRATRLQDLADELKNTKQHIKQSEEEVESMDVSLKSFLKDHFEPAEKEYKATEDMRNCAEQIDRLKLEKGWVFIREQEESITANDKALADAEDKLSDYLQREDEQRDVLANFNQQKLQTSEEVKNFVVREKECNQRLSERKKLKNDASKALHEAELARQRAIKDMQSQKKEIQKLKEQKEQMLIQADRAKAQKQGRSVSTLRELEMELATLAATRQSALADLDQKTQDMEICKQTLDEAKSQLKDKSGNLDRANRDLQALQRSNVSKLGLFGPNVERIDEAVRKKEHSFHGSLLVGPIGKYIQVKKDHSQWRMALADAVGVRLCRTYLVDNQNTSKNLKSLVESLRLPGPSHESDVPIAIANKDVFHGVNVHGSEKTLMDVVEISHPDEDVRRCISNFLVDNAKINELRLCDSYESCKANTDPTRRAEPVILPNGVRHIPSRDSFFIERDGAVRKLWVRGRATGSNAVRCRDVFPVDLASAERDAKNKAEGLKREASTAQEEVKRADADMVEKKKGWEKAKKLLAEVGSDIGKVEKKKSEEEAREQQDEEAEAMAEVHAFESEILKKQEEAEKLEAEKLPGLDEEVVKTKEISAEAERAYREAKQEADKIEEDAKVLKDSDGEVNRGRNEAERELVKLEQKITMKRREIDDKKQSKQTLQAELATSLSAMSDCGERMDTDRQSHEVAREIAVLEKQLQQQQQKSKKRADEVSKRYKAALHKKEGMEEVHKAYEGLVIQLRECYAYRKKALGRRRKKVGKYVNDVFSRLLSVKNFSGQLSFNHNEGTMETVVHTGPGHERPAEGGSKKRKSDEGAGPKTKELSGGERSMSTLCLVLALAEASETPLVALDEFDVFMDEANRNASLLILCEQRRKENSQTILISPHAMAALPSAPDIHKFHMPRIDRDQRSIRTDRSSQASGA